ncbi:MAG TPA: alpha-glucosidase family protein [Mesorhizobium sp.]|jgi:alpha-glucosidase|nr:alpha-glucosidase family protein [Mesorhizobium sp.]
MGEGKRAAGDDWWRGGVIYQIYPRSFQDTNGDGVGDLLGIAARLPYVASLGVDAIWVSPFFRSPMKDFGYDVSDYCDIDPIFGTLHDFDRIVAEAHRLGLKVMIDLVLSHTSDTHPWFAESRSSRANPKSDWYVWADPKPDGTPPNNWLSIFGGPAWEWDTRRLQYYLHNFLAAQPDLNFHNADVQDAVLDVVRFWLERGVDGFRLDTINFYFHSAGLEDNPPLPSAMRNEALVPAVNPYNHQDHLHDKNQPENLVFLERFRALLDRYGARASVGEVGESVRGTELMAQYTSGDARVHMCYSFDLLSSEPPTGARIREVVEGFEQVAPEGWACWAFSNHDVMRHASRWGRAHKDRTGFLKAAAALILSLRGSVCLYQGEELGLTEADLRFEDLADSYGIRFWPEFKGRDGCRTPMVWEGAGAHGGFSDAERTWLPVPDEHLGLAVDRQDTDEKSLLGHYRRFLAFRGSQPALRSGSLRFLHADAGTVAFSRRLDGEEIVCAVNLSAEPATIAIDEMGELEALDGHGMAGELGGNGVFLPRYGAWFGRRAQRR